MGVLTVASLLPAELDPESFSGATLQALLDNLHAEREQVRLALFSHLERELRAGEGLQGVSSFNVQTAGLPTGSPELDAIARIQTVANLQNQVRAMEAKIAVNKALQDLELQVEDFKRNVAAGRYREAAWGLLQLKKIAEDGRAGEAAPRPTHSGRTTDTASSSAQQQQQQQQQLAGLGAMDAMLEWCGSSLAQQLQSDCSSMMQASREHRYMSVRQLTPFGASLPELWGTLALTQQLQLHMEPLVATLSAQVLQPLLESACTVSTSLYDASVVGSSTAQQGSSGPVAVLQWMPAELPVAGAATANGGAAPPAAAASAAAAAAASAAAAAAVQHSADSVLEAGRGLLVFLATHLCGGEAEAVQVFGRLLWPRLVSTFTQCLVQPLLLHSQPATEAVEQLLAASMQLEQHAGSLGLIPSTDTTLSAAVDGLVRGSVHDRRQKYLARARQLMGDQHQESVEAGAPLSVEGLGLLGLGGQQVVDMLVQGTTPGSYSSSPLLSDGYYHIPAGTHQLLALLEEGVVEACSCNSEAAARAIHAALEGVVVVVQQLVRRMCGPQCPGPLLLLHCNGLRHLEQQLMLLPVRGGTALRQACPCDWSFPSQRQALHQLHTSLLSSLAQSEAASLLDLLQPLLQPWRLNNAQAGIARRKAVSQVAHSLGRLGRALLDAAPATTLVRVAAGVLSGVCSGVVERLLSKDDIGAEESSELSSCFKAMAEDGLKALLQGGQHSAAAKMERSGLSAAMLCEAVVAGAGSYRKLLCVCAMLDAKLVQIVEWWEAGRLEAAGLEAGEVHHLVMALFEDNEHRRRCMQRIVRA